MPPDMGICFIGCHSHKLNLAVQQFLEPIGGTLGQLHNLMLKLKRLKKRAAFRRHTQLSPICLNDTRWSSTFNMWNRFFFELKDFIDVSDPDLAPHIPSASETMIVQDLFKNLKFFELVLKIYKKRLSQCLKHVYRLIHFLNGSTTPFGLVSMENL